MAIENEMSRKTGDCKVEPHSTRIVVWDLPTAIECGNKFNVKFGVKCSSECRPDGWVLEVSDNDGNKQASATLRDEVWPDTTALYYTEVELTAPDSEGLHAWEAKVPATEQDIPHSECVASFNVRVVATPECILTVEAIDRESQTPVKGARVVVHPYRAVTDESGLAELRVPKGEYRLFVSGKNYFPFRSDNEVKTDMTIRAELTLDRELSDADVYS
ncbi:MAG: carboxypeptidase regulatory-like domain-containing protein [Proteobacteria bacterium]|nr:carboxypeptidase regulatory-like domain-containing protein [Pseudomonadota bacterium]